MRISYTWAPMAVLTAGLVGCSTVKQSDEAQALLDDRTDRVVVGGNEALSREQIEFIEWVKAERAISFPQDQQPMLIFPRSFSEKPPSSYPYQTLRTAIAAEMPVDFRWGEIATDLRNHDNKSDHASCIAGDFVDQTSAEALIQYFRQKSPDEIKLEETPSLVRIPFVWFLQDPDLGEYIGPQIIFLYHGRGGSMFVPGSINDGIAPSALYKQTLLHEFAHNLDKSSRNPDWDERYAELYAVMRSVQKAGQENGVGSAAWHEAIMLARRDAANRLWTDFHKLSALNTGRPTYDAGELMLRVLENDAALVRENLNLSPPNLLYQVVMPLVQNDPLTREKQIEIATGLQKIRDDNPPGKTELKWLLPLKTMEELDFKPTINMGNEAHYLRVLKDSNIDPASPLGQRVQSLTQAAEIIGIPQTPEQEAELFKAAQKRIEDLLQPQAPARTVDLGARLPRTFDYKGR